jgi:hypothetical protein
MDIRALIRLWNVTQQHPGTSGAEVAARVLLGLYNGPRFPLDLTELRRLDGTILMDAMAVIGSDANQPIREIHVWLNLLSDRLDFGSRFEQLAYDYNVKGRCKRSELRNLLPESILILPKDVEHEATHQCFTG